MNASDIGQTLRSFIGDFVRGGAHFDDNQNIFQAGFVNSLFVMQLVLFVETKFGLVVEHEDMNLANFSSVSALTRFIQSKQLVGARA